jgi:SpoVK/Ycf46/Vps4 family AAA+-type ATPase
VIRVCATRCGKTLLARVIAAESRANFIEVRATEVLSKYLGDSEARLRGMFEKARGAAPCIVFIDELDALAANREGGDEGAAGAVYARLLSTLLNEMDGVSGRDGG